MNYFHTAGGQVNIIPSRELKSNSVIAPSKQMMVVSSPISSPRRSNLNKVAKTLPTKAGKKRVRFSKLKVVREIPHRNTMSSEELEARWYPSKRRQRAMHRQSTPCAPATLAMEPSLVSNNTPFQKMTEDQLFTLISERAALKEYELAMNAIALQQCLLAQSRKRLSLPTISTTYCISNKRVRTSC